MFTKCRIGGNLLDYFRSSKDKMKQPRPHQPVRLRGHCEPASNLLEALAPAFVHEDERRRTRHLRRHLRHLMLCFSENQKTIEAAFEKSIKGIEALFLAGLPKDSLSFVWYEHAREVGTHAHGALALSLLPRGGPFQPRLAAGLLQDFDRLASRALGLSDPMAGEGARLVLSGWASWKPENKPAIADIFRKTEAAYDQGRGRLKTHGDFLKMLEQERKTYRILYSPGPSGQARRHQSAPNHLEIPLYKNTVAVQTTKDQRTIVLKGPVCRPTFTAEAWEQTLEKRRAAAQELRDSPHLVYERFARLFTRHAQAQQQRYRLPACDPGQALNDLAWLKPTIAVQDMRPSAIKAAADKVATLPDLYYPFHCDYEESVWEPEFDPRLATLEDVEGLEDLSLHESTLEESGEDLLWPRKISMPPGRGRSPAEDWPLDPRRGLTAGIANPAEAEPHPDPTSPPQNAVPTGNQLQTEPTAPESEADETLPPPPKVAPSAETLVTQANPPGENPAVELSNSDTPPPGEPTEPPEPTPDQAARAEKPSGTGPLHLPVPQGEQVQLGLPPADAPVSPKTEQEEPPAAEKLKPDSQLPSAQVPAPTPPPASPITQADRAVENPGVEPSNSDAPPPVPSTEPSEPTPVQIPHTLKPSGTGQLPIPQGEQVPPELPPANDSGLPSAGHLPESSKTPGEPLQTAPPEEEPISSPWRCELPDGLGSITFEGYFEDEGGDPDEMAEEIFEWVGGPKSLAPEAPAESPSPPQPELQSPEGLEQTSSETKSPPNIPPPPPVIAHGGRKKRRKSLRRLRGQRVLEIGLTISKARDLPETKPPAPSPQRPTFDIS